MVRLKGVGRSPLSVARVGLLAVGPEETNGGGARKTKEKQEEINLNEINQQRRDADA